jgi:protease I
MGGNQVAKELQGKKVAILAADGVERVELEQPRGALYGAGADSDLLSIHPGEIEARQFDMVSAATLAVDRLVSDASVDDYDALLLPGGTRGYRERRRPARAIRSPAAWLKRRTRRTR